MAAAVTRSRLVAIVVAAYALEKGNSDVVVVEKESKKDGGGGGERGRVEGGRSEQRAADNGQ